MATRLSYADAVTMLGGRNSKVVAALDSVAGGAIIAGSVAFPGLLGWLDAKTEFVRLSQQLVTALAERRSGLSRYSRTQRLEAAHVVIVVAAYFAALEAAELPVTFASLELTRKEQLTIAVGDGSEGFVSAIHAAKDLLPGPQYPYEVQLELFTDYYTDLSRSLLAFLSGLAVWERLPETERRAFRAALDDLPADAVRRYEELYRRLGVDFPEVGFWWNQSDHRATRSEIRKIGTALTALSDVLHGMSTGRAPDERRAALTAANEAALESRVVETEDVPAGLRVPTLREAYVPPLFRAADVTTANRASEESWWTTWPVRPDLQEFLIGHLTSPRAMRAPLLLLGQPGSGKSVLTKVLAASLPVADFMTVRVVLRNVPATADIQAQIEHGIRDLTGERLDWPALVRSAGDAIPVVLLDGFDELIQATGVSQTDYLAKIAEFQHREAVQRRPVVVVVTSRTSVAHRARAPEGTVAVRLEPFDRHRVAAWLNMWNTVNAGYLWAKEIAPLTTDEVMRRQSLAGQPLLLLMLALYNADGNTLQRLAAEISQEELYERLLSSFALREVMKRGAGLPERDLAEEAEQELRRLSVVAFAMFNRNSQWVTESELARDLRAILGESAAPQPYDMRAPLGQAEAVLGRFFFIHRARALRDETRLETYEFLHATFGEFLVARLTWLVLRDVAKQEAVSTFAVAEPNDDLLHALLSFSALSGRAPTVGFLAEMAERVGDGERHTLRGLLLKLFRSVHQPRAPRKFDGYAPRAATVPARHAAYSANLVLLAVCVSGTVRASELFETEHVVEAWHAQALLWRSQLRPEESTRQVESFAVTRLFDDGRRDIALSLDDGSFQAPPVDLYWTYGITPADPLRGTVFTRTGQHAEFLRRRAHFLCATDDDVVQHALGPLSDLFPSAASTFACSGGSAASAAHALLDLWTVSTRTASHGEQRTAYLRCVEMANGDLGTATERRRYAELVLDRLATDAKVPAWLAAEVLEGLKGIRGTGDAIVRCAVRFLGQDPEASRQINDVLRNVNRLLDHDRAAFEVGARLIETGWLTPDDAEWIEDVLGYQRARRLRRALTDESAGDDESPGSA